MNGNIGAWGVLLLLSMLLAVVPAAGTAVDHIVVPDLKVNQSIETIAVSGGLTLQPELEATAEGTFGIPFGSVVVHAADGKTLVFDRNGNHLLSIDDELSAKVPTPGGVEKPCTWVHELPNDSLTHYRDNTIFVLDTAGNLILTIINANPAPETDPITVDITAPKDGDEVWIDVVPPHVTVAGEVHAPAGVRNVFVLSGKKEVWSGNRSTFSCSVPVSAGGEHDHRRGMG
ncbi:MULTISPECIES: hypothetical protein [unclassified Methanoculleus]|jgi:hypothetical protein|uniref:NHL repeat containing protein n=3 Tax=Methanoculleus TaxID=45989 RepID=A0ABD8A9B3_9EURY|nr:hypothetical protein [Methanoculleus sp.]WOX56093.1 hypothetical protein R6Y95_01860 [Methanoculleus palmolei]